MNVNKINERHTYNNIINVNGCTNKGVLVLYEFYK